MRRRFGSVAGYFVLAAVVVAIAWLAISFGQLAIGIFVFPGIPLVLLWFVYMLFLRRWLRLRRIRNARERREMREAVLRGRSPEGKGSETKD